jgi:hypothetical protein
MSRPTLKMTKREKVRTTALSAATQTMIPT